MRIIEYAKFHFELYMHDRNTALDILTSCIWVHRLVFRCVKCKVQKGFFALLKLQKKKRNCWNVPCQNLHVTRRHGHTEYSMSGSCLLRELFVYVRPWKSTAFRHQHNQHDCWTLCFWLAKFIEEVCKQNGERYPARALYSVVCGPQRYLETENGSLAISLLFYI